MTTQYAIQALSDDLSASAKKRKEKTMLSISCARVGKALRMLLCAGLLVLGAAMPFGVSTQNTAMAKGCSGSGCMGLNPETMGCGTGALTGPSTSSGGALIENRYNTTCNAEWARTTNQSGGNRYAAATIRHGGSQYNQSSQNVSSPGLIANGQRVYTPMVGPDSTIDSLSCGSVSTAGPIQTPVWSPCTTVS